MKHFYGGNQTKAYFEGWYCKHQSEEHTVALIFALHLDQQGKGGASIQVITEHEAANISFPAQAFAARSDRFGVKIGETVVSERGIRINLHTDALSLCGALRYGPFVPPRGDVMGPFALLPAMQCRHRVLSLRHSLSGRLLLNGKSIDFSDATGYLEGDRGSSFPRRYFWSQCNRFAQEDCCVMVSIAEVPVGGTVIPGCICCVRRHGRELRLATYLGARPLWWDETGAAVVQGRFLLLVEPLRQEAQPLRAPSHGTMSRVIRESAAAAVRYRLYENGRTVFDLTGGSAGFEFSEEPCKKGGSPL